MISKVTQGTFTETTLSMLPADDDYQLETKTRSNKKKKIQLAFETLTAYGPTHMKQASQVGRYTPRNTFRRADTMMVRRTLARASSANSVNTSLSKVSIRSLQRTRTRRSDVTHTSQITSRRSAEGLLMINQY